MGPSCCAAFVCLLSLKKYILGLIPGVASSPRGILESAGILSGQDQSSAGSFQVEFSLKAKKHKTIAFTHPVILEI